jgi:hypothetical protein
MDAHRVTGGAASHWTSDALHLLFGVDSFDYVPVELFPTVEEQAHVVRTLLERSARDAGFVQDSDGVWHLPS